MNTRQNFSATNTCRRKSYRIYFYVLIFIASPIYKVLAQQIINANLYQFVYKTCQDQYYEIDVISYLQYIICQPTDEYLLESSRVSCSFERNKIENNNTLKLEGAGVGDYTILQRSNGTYYFRVKFVSTAPYTISWKMRYHYPTNNCGRPAVDEYTYTWTSRKVFSVPKPPVPTIAARKAVVKISEATEIVCNNCPNTLDGETDYPYSNGESIVDWAYQCAPDGQPDFVNVVRTYTPFILPFNSTHTFYKPGAVFRVRCSDNGCLSEKSEPVAVSIQYTAPTCGDTKMDEIDGYTKDSRSDYHYYMTETVICDKVGDPNCTQANVFALLKSSKVFAAPAAIDFTPINVLAMGRLNPKIALLGSSLLFNENQTSVNNCETVNLAGPGGLFLNLAALTAGISSYLIERNLTALNPVANPVTQFIDEQAFSVTNYTQPYHILYPGKTTRIVVDACNQVKIITIGNGRSWAGDNFRGKILSGLNVIAGKYILFPNADLRITNAYQNKYK